MIKSIVYAENGEKKHEFHVAMYKLSNTSDVFVGENEDETIYYRLAHGEYIVTRKDKKTK